MVKKFENVEFMYFITDSYHNTVSEMHLTRDIEDLINRETNGYEKISDFDTDLINYLREGKYLSYEEGGVDIYDHKAENNSNVMRESHRFIMNDDPYYKTVYFTPTYSTIDGSSIDPEDLTEERNEQIDYYNRKIVCDKVKMDLDDTWMDTAMWLIEKDNNNEYSVKIEFFGDPDVNGVCEFEADPEQFLFDHHMDHTFEIMGCSGNMIKYYFA